MNTYITFVLYDGKLDGNDTDQLYKLQKGNGNAFDETRFISEYFPICFAELPDLLEKDTTNALSSNKAFMANIEKVLPLAMYSLGFELQDQQVKLMSDDLLAEWGNYNITTYQNANVLEWTRLGKVCAFMIWTGMQQRINETMDIINTFINDGRCAIDKGWWTYLQSQYFKQFKSIFTPTTALAIPVFTSSMFEQDTTHSTGQIDFSQIRMALLTP